MKRSRVHSPYVLEAAQLLGTEVARARRERRWTIKGLAERAGVSSTTLSKVEQGDPTVALGTAFEVAALVGISLFNADPDTLTEMSQRSRERLAVLPSRVREPRSPVKDDF